MQPSAASTSSRTPLTIFSTRSTSPPKSAWPGGVDDVDLDAVVLAGAVLGQNRDAALTLDVAGVHDALGHLLVGTESTGLLQHLVDRVVLPWSTCAMIATLRRFS